MILKGSQRKGGTDLATHLLNEFDNDDIAVAELKGTVAGDLHGAFSEYEAAASGTRCQKPLYSLSINPSSPISRAQYQSAIERIEKRLGLSGQKRAVVFHVKNGREHCHVVWSRIDVKTMTAIHISHDHLKLRTLARELAAEFNLHLPPGLREDRPYDVKYRERGMSMGEKARAEETGITPKQRKKHITDIYNDSANPEMFISKMERVGYTLAKGDRRDFVIIDRYGHIHSLSRQIDGVKAKDPRKIFPSLNPDNLPTAAQVRERLRKQKNDHDKDTQNRPGNRFEKEKQADLTRLEDIQKRRRYELDQERYDQELVHRSERLALHAAQLSEKQSLFSRVASKVLALAYKLPALHSVLMCLHTLPKIGLEERHRLENEALKQRHEREKHILDRKAESLAMVEARELRSLNRKYLRLARTEKRSRQGRSIQTVIDLQENITDITILVPKEKPSRQQRTEKNLQTIRINAADLTAKPAGKGRANALLNKDSRSQKFSRE
mgnify:CR=1 FL=1|jgi:hypothetical protein